MAITKSIINVFKDAMTQKQETVKDVVGKSLEEIFPTYDFTNALISVNGRKENEKYIIKEGDSVAIRFYPQAGATAVITTVSAWVSVALAVVSVGAVILWNVCPAFKSWVKGLLLDNQDNVENIKNDVPNISGINNSSAKDKPIPIVLGEHLLTPNFIGKPYTDISNGTTEAHQKGKKRTFHVLFNLGYKNIEIKDIKLKYIDLASNSNKIDGKNTHNIPCDSKYYDSIKDTVKLEFQQDGEDVSIYNQRTIQQDFSTELIKVVDRDLVPVNVVSATNPKEIEVELGFQGLYSTNDNGSLGNKEVKCKVEYSLGNESSGLTSTSYSQTAFDYNTDHRESHFVNPGEFFHWYISPDTQKMESSIRQNFELGQDIELYNKSLFTPYEEGIYWIYSYEWKRTEYSSNRRYEYPIYTVNVSKVLVEYQNWKTIPITGWIEDAKDAGVYCYTANDNEEMRFIAKKAFDYNELKSMFDDASPNPNYVNIRITRISDNSTSTRDCDKMYLTAVRTKCFDFDESKKSKTLVNKKPCVDEYETVSARLGFEVEANEAIKNNIEALNCIVTSKAPVPRLVDNSYIFYEEDILDESKWVATNNPASLALLLFRHPSLKENRYSLDKINLDKLAELYAYCEKPNPNSTEKLTCNMVISSQSKFGEVMYKVLACGHAFPILDNNQFSFIIDKPQENPVLIINNHNILASGRKNSKEFSEIPDRFCIRYINKNCNYQEDYCYVWKDDETRMAYESGTLVSPTTENISLEGYTDYASVWRRGRYEYRKRILRPEVYSVPMSVDGDLCGVGDMAEIQDDTLLVGLSDGGVITELFKDSEGEHYTGFSIDSDIAIDDGAKNYCVKMIQSNGIDEPVVNVYELNISDTGVYNRFEFKNPILLSQVPAPKIGDLCSFGEYGKETEKVICISKQQKSDNTFDMIFVPYQESLYEDDGEVPEFTSNVSRPVTGDGLGSIPFTPTVIDGYSPYILNVLGENVIKNNAGTVELYPNVIRNGVVVDKIPAGYKIKWYKDGGLFKTFDEGNSVEESKITLSATEINDKTIIQCKLEK